MKHIPGMLSLIILLSLQPVNADTDTAKLRVLTHTVFPVSYMDTSENKIAGFATEYLRDILEKAGVEYSLELLPWSRAYNIALKEPNTLLYGIARTGDREQHFIWFEELFTSHFALYGLSSNTELAGLDMLSVKKRPIGVIRNHVIQTTLRKQGFVNIIEADTNEHLVNLLINNRVDYISISTSGAELMHIKTKFGIDQDRVTPLVDLPFLKYSIYYALNPETDPELLNSLTIALESLKSDPDYVRPQPSLKQ